jgi:uncharacterized glyoxalase superfamily protein PhnB
VRHASSNSLHAADMSAKGVLFSMPPKKQDFGGVLAQFVDSEGAHCSVGAEAAQWGSQ